MNRQAEPGGLRRPRKSHEQVPKRCQVPTSPQQLGARHRGDVAAPAPAPPGAGGRGRAGRARGRGSRYSPSGPRGGGARSGWGLRSRSWKQGWKTIAAELGPANKHARKRCASAAAAAEAAVTLSWSRSWNRAGSCHWAGAQGVRRRNRGCWSCPLGPGASFPRGRIVLSRPGGVGCDATPCFNPLSAAGPAVKA